MQWLIEQTEAIWRGTLTLLSSPEFYAQIGIVGVALVLAWALAAYLKSRVKVFGEEPQRAALYEVRAR